jgi:hypothetical protein
LKGDSIPLAARLVRVADIYEALTSNPHFRAAFSQSQALDIMKMDRRQYDPVLLDIPLKVLQEGETKPAQVDGHAHPAGMEHSLFAPATPSIRKRRWQETLADEREGAGIRPKCGLGHIVVSSRRPLNAPSLHIPLRSKPTMHPAINT